MLDTTFLIDLQRAPDRRKELVMDLQSLGEDLVVPAQAALEFSSGLKDPIAGLTAIERSFRVEPFEDALLRVAATLAQEAHRQGRFPGWPDIHIAATAHHLGMSVVTRNGRHFEPLGVDVLAYEA